MSSKKFNENRIISPYGNEEVPIISKQGPVQSSILKNTDSIKSIPGLTQEVSESVSKKFKYSFSYIEKWEEETAKKMIEEHLGFPRPRPTGYHIAVKIYVRPSEISEFVDPNTGKKKYIYAPEIVTARDKFINCSALVLAVGPWAYQDKNKYGEEPWCRVGDWIVIPRNEGTQVNYRGVPIQYIADDRVLDIIEDPELVTRD